MSAQLPLFVPESRWTPPNLDDLPNDWGSGRVGIDVETRDDQLAALGPGVRRGGYVVGISLAFEDGPAYYLPVAHAGGGNMDRKSVRNYLRYHAKRFTGIVCGANLAYDLDYLWEGGIEFPNAEAYRDVQIADPLINELHYSYSLESISERWGIPGKDESLLQEALFVHGYKGRNSKAGIWALHSQFVGPYAEQDARLPLTILRKQEREIENQDLWRIYDLESRVLPVLVKMRRRGVRVNLDRLDEIERWARAEQVAAMDAANRLTTVRLETDDISRTAVLATALREIGLDLPQTKTGKDSVTASLLESLDHPIGEHLRRAKKMFTLRSTFCDGVRHHLIGNRIHCTFNQLRRQKDDGSGDQEGAAFGRLSSTNPNLQNQPARDPEIGKKWRSIYEPETGSIWGSLDYSQQEPRHAVESALDTGARIIGQAAYDSAVEACNRYRNDPTMDFHQMMADMAAIERKPAKNIFLGLSYGMGGAKLCRDLGLPTVWTVRWKEDRRWRYKSYETREEAAIVSARGRAEGYDARYYEAAGPEGQELTDQFDRKVPFVRKMAQHMQDVASRQGYIETIGGRRCRFPALDGGGYDWLHKAFNRRIQGSSADQTKEAVVAIDAAGYYLQLQVHDEVDGSFGSEEEAKKAATIMENVYPMKVPMKVDVETGLSWGDSM